jgi:GTPase Era involved in 16S rRNA processing
MLGTSQPVRVVSSMGEQSVGKSFALNHLVDTSFAGSAMRTTEGVWMSVTPTKESLIVALDFEGKFLAELVLSNPFQ